MPDPTWDADTLVSRFDEVRAHTEALARPLSPEDQTVQGLFVQRQDAEEEEEPEQS